MLEEAGYKVSTHTDGDWEATTTRGEVIVLKRDIGICNRMAYIDLCEHAEGLVMLETVEKNTEMFTKKELGTLQKKTHEANRKSAKSEEHPHQNL